MKYLIKALDESIAEIQFKLGKIESLNIDIRDNYLADYWEMKSELESSRDTLKELAFRTIKTVRDIKILMESWNDHDSELASYTLEKGIDMLKELLDESERHLAEAQLHYREAIKFMGSKAMLPVQLKETEKAVKEFNNSNSSIS